MISILSFENHRSKFEVPKKFLDEINKSEIINTVLDWYKQKSAAEDAKIIRQLNKQSGKGLKRPDKYITCSSKVKKNRYFGSRRQLRRCVGFRE